MIPHDCPYDAGGTACPVCADATANVAASLRAQEQVQDEAQSLAQLEAMDRRTAGDPSQWVRDVIEERRRQLRADDDARLRALIEAKGPPLRRVLVTVELETRESDDDIRRNVTRRLLGMQGLGRVVVREERG